MDTQLANVIITGLVGLFTVVVVPLVGWLLSHRMKATDEKLERVEAKLDMIPAQFAATHSRISDVKEDVAHLDARLEAHLDESRHGREGRGGGR